MSFIGSALSGLLGGNASGPQINFSAPSFTAGGLNAQGGLYGGYDVTPTADRSAVVGNISNTFQQQAGAYGNLASQWTPGFSQMRQTQLGALNANRTQALGDLRQNLAQRRVLGSSFAQNSLANADQTYQNQISQTMAQSYLQELQANQSIIQQQYGASVNAFQTQLNEMNLEAGMASDLTSKMSGTMANLAQAQSNLDAKAAQGSGQFWGNIGSQAGSFAMQMLPMLMA